MNIICPFRIIWYSLNLEWSFLTGCHTKFKGSSLPGEGELLDSYISQDYYRYMKCKQPHPGFKLGLTDPFLTITVMPGTLLYCELNLEMLRTCVCVLH